LSNTYISAELRRLVVARADSLCEYCLLHEDDAYFGCQVDHIISEKHGGLTDLTNLAYACTTCNRSKGSDVGSIVMPLSRGLFSRFFNPRTDEWREHFKIDSNDILIVPLSDIGEVTARILGFNSFERLLERQTLCKMGRYPTLEALRLLRLLDH
jgi:HNH endonuclease